MGRFSGDRKHPGGRPAFKPTSLQRVQVETLAGVGATHELIAEFLGVSVETLLKYFEAELRESRTRLDMQIGSRLAQKALKGDNACMIFYLKTRAGWSEKQIREVTGKDGGPLEILTGVMELPTERDE